MTQANESILKLLFGDQVELEGQGGKPEHFKIMAELSLGGRDYAVLQSDAMKAEGDIEVFRVVVDGNGTPQLETVEDDEEWENVAEAYDDLLFGSEDRP
ncbi:DUF1292 domain-containing protein [Cohnella lubricantis]|uniref:DUF1292 domain-containing protein n=1 Tax=Cohnella lubricantis TaxID=2163172 RepID=A0A841T9Y5_9BACL|nr:DUF1292 domain-containing protein [Cohnella lubricantis]MBB6675847.1 DUF1292 domain-containing protein [Cohnella lubricantis]MBP2119739.1 uncharacterized protein YrzB (UPF0473 family) [Cohnella lubricantis]